MGRRASFSAVLLVAALLILCFSHGSGRNVIESFRNEGTNYVIPEAEEESREMMELDYVDAGPNVNAKSGYLFPPPPPPPPTPPPPAAPAPAED